jgi:Na+/H+ antiporter NhaD/arsenite permease-like protein
MFILIILIFVLGYAAIALEHPLRVNKAAPALLTGMLIWTAIMVGHDRLGLAATPDQLVEQLYHHLSSTASILFFLLGAMTVVELIDAHSGFQVVTDRIATTNRRRLLWLVGLFSFVLSAILDNLTTAIVMAALMRKLVADRDDLWTFGGVVIIAANAGGAWSPIGDVTTIMLWIGGQVTTWNIIVATLLPSLVCLALPLLWLTRTLQGDVRRPDERADNGAGHVGEHVDSPPVPKHERITVFVLGLATLLGVPLFKSLTHLPPFMGIMFGLGILWVYTEIVHARSDEDRGQYQVSAMLMRSDHASILFFLGILIAIGGLETSGHLARLATSLDQWFPNVFALNTVIGLLSAIVDNVPLVAAAQGMYPLTVYPTDHVFWELLALCAGTGGSLLIFGSAAGVAVMGVLRMDFMWYVRRMLLPAALGYAGAVGTFWLMWG